MLQLKIPEVPPTPNEFMRMHYHKRSSVNKHWHELISNALECQQAHFNEPVEITMYSYRSRLLDIDGLYGSIKPILDALVSNGVLDDDSPEYVVDLHCKQFKTARAQAHIELSIF